MQKRGWLYYFASLLIILGVVGHEVIPHHHHYHNASDATTSHQTCSIHNHSDSDCDGDEKDHACSIFEYNPLGNVRLNIIDFSKKIECKNLSFFLLFSDFSTTIFVPYQRTAFRFFYLLKKPATFFKSFSHRGPPVL